MIRLILFSALLTILFSCKKETIEYQEAEITSCEMCPYMSSLVGTYRGPYWHKDNVDSMGYFVADTMDAFVEQIFLENSQYQDSTIMWLKATYEWDGNDNIVIDTLRVENTSGHIGDFAYNYGNSHMYAYTGQYTFYPDSLFFFMKLWTSPSGPMNLIIRRAELSKQ